MLAQHLFDVGAGRLDVWRLAFGFGIGRLALALDIYILCLAMDGNGLGVEDGRLALALDVTMPKAMMTMKEMKAAKKAAARRKSNRLPVA